MGTFDESRQVAADEPQVVPNERTALLREQTTNKIPLRARLSDLWYPLCMVFMVLNFAFISYTIWVGVSERYLASPPQDAPKIRIEPQSIAVIGMLYLMLQKYACFTSLIY